MQRYGNDLESRFLFEHNIVFQNNKSNSISDILTNLVKTEKYYMGPSFISVPAGNYMYKNTRTRCKICSKLTIKKPEQGQWRHFGVFLINFEHISHFVLVFLLLTMNR